MACKAIRVSAETTNRDDGKPAVIVVMGNMRRVGCLGEIAWAEIQPGMAREIARNLLEAADEVERAT